MAINPNHTYIAKTFYGLEQLLADEIQSLGGTDVCILNRAVQFTGNLACMYRVNRYSRYAIRIILPIESYQSSHEKQFYKNARRIQWNKWIQPHQTLYIDCVAHSKWVKNSHYIKLLLKDAICDWYKEKTGTRPSIDTKNPDIRIVVNIHQDNVQISLDTSGDPLFKRGYRTKANAAPLNEVLAAGIVALSGWDKQTPLVDGMCGSGTFVIEALAMYHNTSPHVKERSFGFARWKNYDRNAWRNILSENLDEKEDEYPNIIGLEIDRKTVSIAKDNMTRAGFLPFHHIKQQDFFSFSPKENSGTLLLNPPYNFRLQNDDIEGFYKKIGDHLKHHFTGWKAWIFSSNLSALKRIGLRSSKKIKLFNGPNESRLVLFELY